ERHELAMEGLTQGPAGHGELAGSRPAGSCASRAADRSPMLPTLASSSSGTRTDSRSSAQATSSRVWSESRPSVSMSASRFSAGAGRPVTCAIPAATSASNSSVVIALLHFVDPAQRPLRHGLVVHAERPDAGGQVPVVVHVEPIAPALPDLLFVTAQAAEPVLAGAAVVLAPGPHLEDLPVRA